MIVSIGLKQAFPSATGIYVDTDTRECEVTISVDDFQGENIGYIVENKITFRMIDYVDVFPFKYVFSYRINGQSYLA